jgi:hypothetical protein
MFVLAILASLGIVTLEDCMDGGGPVTVRRPTYEDYLEMDRVPEIGSVYVSRDGEWLLAFSEFFRLEEAKFWKVVSNGDSCYGDFIGESKSLPGDLLLVRYRGDSKTLVSYSMLKAGEYPEEVFERMHLWREVGQDFKKATPEDKRHYLLFMIEITASEAFGR